jgi:hypothetical protein
MRFRRGRGLLLRLVKRRAAAVLVGLVLIVPAAWIECAARVDQWWLEGLALIAGATGVAFLWTGVRGVTPDWIDRVRRL